MRTLRLNLMAATLLGSAGFIHLESQAQALQSPSAPSVSSVSGAGEVQSVAQQIQMLAAQIAALGQELAALVSQLQALQAPPAPGPNASAADRARYEQAMREFANKRAFLLNRIQQIQSRIDRLEQELARVGSLQLTAAQKADRARLQESLANSRKKLSQAKALAANLNTSSGNAGSDSRQQMRGGSVPAGRSLPTPNERQ
jgi:DNA repair exonuclease SbcCD ATPase subunit